MPRRNKLPELRQPGRLILPSMLLCDFGNLRAEVDRLSQAGFRALHLDVMDGVFVPNFSYGITLVKAFRELTDLFLDVHLMMIEPQKYISEFYEAGADSITFHIEATRDAAAIVEQIHALGMVAGVAIDRDTPVSRIEQVASQCDLILVMTIKAGFGGQKFIPGMLDKLPAIRKFANDRVILQVDGGVNAETIQSCVQAGAEWMVAGSAVFNAADYRQTHHQLLELANDVSKCRN